MKRTLNTLVIVGGLFLACGSWNLARAQNGSTDSGQEPATQEQKTERDRPNLNLTDDQKAQMKKIHEDAKAQIEAVNSDSALSADQKEAKIKQLHRGTHKQVEAILTPEQKKTMREWRREHRGSRQQQTPPPSN